MALFEERYAKLNTEQREAVDSIDGPVMVIAGPGTGKTEILTMRVANILRLKKAEPQEILALTFTESGAISMRKRLANLIGQDAYRVEISTFHGFANRIIRDYPEYFPNIIGASNITEIEQVNIVQGLLDTVSLAHLKPFGDPYYYLRAILASINELKRQGIAPDRFLDIAEREKKDFFANPDLINTSGKYEGKMKTKYASTANHVARNGELAELYGRYQKALFAAKQYDYSDMIMYAALALKDDEELRRVLQDAYLFFLIDEHQDTNDAQNNLIELLAAGSERPNLFVVGDEKQAIFRFQGASLENFHYFSRRYKDVKLVSLRNNYRSTQAILDAAQAVSPREAALAAQSGHPETPAHFASLSVPDAEYFFVARKIKELIQSGANPEEIAVLYRDNKDAAPLARMLERERVLFAIESDQDILGDLEIKKLIRILRAVQHFGRDVELAEALHVDFLNIPPIDVYRLLACAARERVKLYDELRSEALLQKANIESRIACQRFFENLSRWKRLAKNGSAAETFEVIVRESGFLASLLNHPAATEKIAKLHVLFDILKSFVEHRRNYSLEDFFAYLDLMEEHGLAIKGADTVHLSGRVRLMTAHRAKGQEFDYVFILNVVDRKWGTRFRRDSITLPNAIYGVMADSSLRKQDALAEDEEARNDDDADERNVFYVALTRARREVFLTMSRTDRDHKEQLPTKFIAELKANVLAPLDVLAYENEFAGNPEMLFREIPLTLPELKDRTFLRELFDAQGISVTALNNYLECPWQYFYRNLIRIPEAPNKHLSFGNAIHASLKSYFDALSLGEEHGKEYLVKRFEEALAREPISESDFEEALMKGRKALPAFYNEYHARWSPRGLNEFKISGVSVGDVLVNGKLDRIVFLEHNAVSVVDYKTGKPKTRNDIEGNTKSSDGNYKRQLVFYKLLLNKEGTYDMANGVIQFVEPDDRGTFHREEFIVNESEVLALEQQIETVAAEIRNLSFWDKACDKKDCKYCDLRNAAR